MSSRVFVAARHSRIAASAAEFPKPCNHESVSSPLRIVAWNANMAVHRKLDALLSLRPDVAIVPECANPATLTAKTSQPITSMVWIGEKPNKGLGVLAFGDYSLELCPEYDARLEWIAPVAVAGPCPFFLLAAWCKNHRASQQHPWQPPRRQIEPAIAIYQDLLRPGATVIAGDLNSNVNWDRPGRVDNFTRTVAAAQRVGLVSAYHTVTNIEFGAEPRPTLYWQTRKLDGRTYHIDYFFIPREWVPNVTSVEVGEFEKWVGSGLSDHVPLTMEVDFAGRGGGNRHGSCSS
jgi:exodeoxyribonuclease-3